MKSDEYFDEKQKELNKKKKKSRVVLIIIIIAFLILLFLQYRLKTPQTQIKTIDNSQLESEVKNLKDSLAIIDSLKKIIQAKKDSILALDSLLADSLSKAQKNSLSSTKGELKGGGQALSLNTDSIAPLWQAEPLAGKYELSVEVSLICLEEKCKVEYSAGEAYEIYSSPIVLKTTTTLKVKATDSVGNVAEGSLEYLITAKENKCGKNGVLISEGSKSFCIDKYEWPNEYGETPLGSVSHTKALEMCQSVGKELCSSEEWQKACEINESSKTRYAYGDSYQRFCVTNTKVAGRSGYKKNCRSWNGVYDLNGNLWEWTSTKDKKLTTRYLAAGGNYAGKNASSCSERTYSFFPQNEYTGVGFRCCGQPK